jgi:pimeloyl-ACP methyl ester carboxylesterase
MNAALAATINRTIVRLPMQAVMRSYFGLASRLLPEMARRQAERWFTRPPRYAGRRTQPPVAARRETVVIDNRRLAVWQAGPATAPAVLLSHGWGGSGVQMGGFVAPLLARGHRVVWFDQPGHGESGRGAVGLPDFVRAVAALAETHGPFEAAVGHSLGAAALALALRRGLRLGRVVFVASPASLSEHAHNFARWIGITPRIREAMRHRVEQRYGVRFADIDRIEELAKLRLPALFVHDSADTAVPFEHTLRLSGHLPGARLLKTHGLGHFRILRDPAVVGAIIGFVGGAGDALPAELPALPPPAPLY